MKTVFKYVSVITALVILAGWSGEQSSGRDSRKQRTNLSGTLTTHTGQKQEYRIGNIAIGNLIEGIRFFELPAQPAGILSEDPHAGAVFEVKLEKGMIIEVPQPGKIWSFKRSERATKVEYVAIAVTPCDQGEKKEYLVETTRHLFGDELGACEPIAMKIPLSQVKKLVIEDNQPWEDGRACTIKLQNLESRKSSSRAQRP